MTDKVADRSYVAGLDGLRAIAVGTVFIGHAFTNVISSASGVDMFFALSGFLITRGLINQGEKTGRIDLRSFYIRRALRIVPALVLMVGVMFGVAVILRLFNLSALRPQIIAGLIALTYTMNWFFALRHGLVGWFAHTWSLAIEEQFYLSWPLLLIAALRYRDRKLASKLALLIALASILLRAVLYHQHASLDRVYSGFDTRADGLLIGCALALSRPFHLAKWAARLWFVPVGALICTALVRAGSIPVGLGFTVGSVSCAWLILPLWTRSAPVLAKVLEFPPIRYLGRISYGLYLWHYSFFCVLWQLHFHQNTIGTAALVGGLSLTCSVLSFHFVEQPILKLKDKLIVKQPAKEPASVDATA